MALFKKKLTLDEILAGIDNLSDEEKLKLGEQLKELYKADDEPETEENYEENGNEEVEENAEGEENVEGEEGKETDGETGQESEDGGSEESEPEPEPEPEAEPEAEEEISEGEEHIEKEMEEFSAIRADIAELKKVVAAIAARFDADSDNEEEGEDIAWGVGAKEAKADTPPESETEKCRRKYFNF